MSWHLVKSWNTALRLTLNAIGLQWCDLCVIEPNWTEETMSGRGESADQSDPAPTSLAL
jgi:hypothetical protein